MSLLSDGLPVAADRAAENITRLEPHAGGAPTDDGRALAFVKAQAGNLRWVERWRRWFQWDGKVWREDGTLGVFDLVRSFLRQHAGRHPGRQLDAPRIAAVEKLSRSDRAAATSPDQLDAHDWLLNTQTGVVNLKTGDLRAHDRDLLLTKITACGVGGDCPRWQRFLLEVTGDDPQLVGFLQRLAGYCLTGSTREHALFFLYGTGGNGKGVFLNTLRAIMADYAEVSSTDVFTASRGDRHPTELAALRGARLVVAQEVEEGRRWAEARIKALTGGDPVSARYMRQDFFEYVPNFKLIIAGNHKPRLVTVDEAIRRRLHLIPFEVSIPEQRRDLDLAEKLAQEHAGILAWAIEGCLNYLSQGLDAPERVKAATDAYFASQDVMSEFLAECCETGPDFWETPTIMFSAWRGFASGQGMKPGRQSEFLDKMEGVGMSQARDNRRGRHWLGIRVKDSAKLIGTGLEAEA